MEKKQYFHAQFKEIPYEDAVKAPEVGTVIKGYASTPTLDRYNDIVEPEAFRKSIASNYRKNPIVLFQHKNDRPIGKATYMSIDENGLYIEAIIVDNEVEPKIKAGILQTFSIGYIPQKTEYQDGDGNVLDPKKERDLDKILFDANVKRIIKEVDLVENSVVSVPANPDAVFTLEKSVKSFFEDDRKALEEQYNLNSKNMDKENLLEKKEEEVSETPEVTEEEVVETPADETSGEVEGDETSTEDETTEVVEEVEEAPEAPVEEAPVEAEEEAVVEEEVVATTEEAPVAPEAETDAPDENTSEKVEAGLDESLVTSDNLTAALKAVIAKDAQIKELEAKLANVESSPAKQPLVYQEHKVAEEKKEEDVSEKKGFKSAFMDAAK